MRQPNLDKIKLSVDAHEKSGTWIKCYCVHPNEPENLERFVSMEEVERVLNMDGQGNVPMCETHWDDAMEEEVVMLEYSLPFAEWLELKGSDFFETWVLRDIINRREGRTEWVTKPLPQLPDLGLVMVSATEAAMESNRTSNQVDNLIKSVGINKAA